MPCPLEATRSEFIAMNAAIKLIQRLRIVFIVVPPGDDGAMEIALPSAKPP
jgi:hypothetical protein